MKEKTITIRKAKKEDLPSLLRLFDEMLAYHEKLETQEDQYWSKLLPSFRTKVNQFFKKNIKSQSSLVLVAEDRQKIIGYCLATIIKNTPIFKIGKYGYISDLLVKKSYQNKGIGKRLLDEAKNFFRKAHLRFMELKVLYNNFPSFKFYQNYGFQEYKKVMRLRI